MKAFRLLTCVKLYVLVTLLLIYQVISTLNYLIIFNSLHVKVFGQVRYDCDSLDSMLKYEELLVSIRVSFQVGCEIKFYFFIFYTIWLQIFSVNMLAKLAYSLVPF